MGPGSTAPCCRLYQMDLEQELWRLRSVEYDLEEARKRIDELEATQEAEYKTAQDAAKRAESYGREADNERLAKRQAIKRADELAVEVDSLKKINERLATAIERYSRHEHMADNYDFHVAQEMPQAGRGNRKNWRLSR